MFMTASSIVQLTPESKPEEITTIILDLFFFLFWGVLGVELKAS
jgi:hypothetical protein